MRSRVEKERVTERESFDSNSNLLTVRTQTHLYFSTFISDRTKIRDYQLSAYRILLDYAVEKNFLFFESLDCLQAQAWGVIRFTSII